MARLVQVEGQTYKERNIWAVWLGLPLITLGIYTLVWYYKVNDEARRYLKDDTISPGMSVLAITLGAFLIVPPFMSIYNTCKRIERMEQRAGITRTIEPIIGLALTFVARLELLYIQAHLNGIWAASGGSLIEQPAALAAPPAPVSPPA